ncbi:MAG: ribonuclease III [Ruminococcaceae bacterium]|nr:ribonuclease III [Oscillospiraceae bacterium]
MMALDVKQVSTAALAYLGDSVWELLVRQMLVGEGISESRRLNTEALGYVTASAQAAAVKRILDALTEEENAVYHRGRNIGHTNVPKRATVMEYRMATGLEALFGYLHLTGRSERIEELFAMAFREEREQ